MNTPFPEISVAGDRIDPRRFVEPGTGMALFGAWIIAILITPFLILMTYGVMLVVILCYPLIAWYLHRKAMAMIHGSGVRVDETQFPSIHACVTTFRERLGIRQDVVVYIVEDNITNAFAVRYGKKNVILLTDDLLHGCLASELPQALAFIIGHEMAHIALHHNGLIRSWIAKNMKKLGRLDEYTADSVALALIGDPRIAFHGLLLLTVGYALLPYVNSDSLIRQAREVAADKYSKKAERTLTHPLILNRIHRLMEKSGGKV